MNDRLKEKPFDLEERTSKFARDTIKFVNTCPRTTANIEIAKQVIRSSGSVGANYIEAREALSKKDFTMRVKICRKEAKESIYWLRLLEVKDRGVEEHRKE
jgi:four helix bundle protein